MATIVIVIHDLFPWIVNELVRKKKKSDYIHTLSTSVSPNNPTISEDTDLFLKYFCAVCVFTCELFSFSAQLSPFKIETK